MAAADDANQARLDREAAREAARQQRLEELKQKREQAYYDAQKESKGEKPEAPAEDENYTYDYVWRQNVGSPTGRWSLVRYPKANLGGNGGGGGGGGGDGANSAGSSDTNKLIAQQQAAAALAAQQAAAAAAEEKRRQGQSAFDLLFSEFDRYGLGALVTPLKDFIVEGLSPAEFTLRLRNTDAYKKRFAANEGRIQKGLRALSEAEYIGLEDQYQNIMRNYGLPASYYTRGDMGRQEGFEKFIANDVSAVELEDRISNAQERVLNSAPEIGKMLRQFYPDITNGDILAYALDPQNALNAIKRKITAAEIGAAATQQGLQTGVSRAEELGRFGVTKQQAQQGFQTIGEFLPSAVKLGDIYAKQGLGAYDQTTAEQEVFGTTGAAEAAKKRKKLAQLETASFSGAAGTTGGALGRERAGQF